MSRFLVTGATGFIGSAVVRRLIADGHEVLALHARQSPKIRHPNLEWLCCDLLADGLPDLSGTDVSHVIHAAWYTNHADYLEHDVNRRWAEASLRLNEAFNAAGGKRFVGLGTCLEYDVARADAPCAEDSTPLRPDTLYARSKLQLFEQLARQCADFAWARLFFVYGPGDRAGRLFPAMLDRLSRGESAGPRFGGVRRDYIHVDDLAGQLARIAGSQVQGPINTGTGEAPTLSEIFVAAARAIRRPEMAQANDETGGQPPLIQADLSRFRRHLGEPEARDVGAGIRDWLREA